MCYLGCVKSDPNEGNNDGLLKRNTDENSVTSTRSRSTAGMSVPLAGINDKYKSGSRSTPSTPRGNDPRATTPKPRQSLTSTSTNNPPVANTNKSIGQTQPIRKSTVTGITRKSNTVTATRNHELTIDIHSSPNPVNTGFADTNGTQIQKRNTEDGYTASESTTIISPVFASDAIIKQLQTNFDSLHLQMLSMDKRVMSLEGIMVSTYADIFRCFM